MNSNEFSFWCLFCLGVSGEGSWHQHIQQQWFDIWPQLWTHCLSCRVRDHVLNESLVFTQHTPLWLSVLLDFVPQVCDCAAPTKDKQSDSHHQHFQVHHCYSNTHLYLYLYLHITSLFCVCVSENPSALLHSLMMENTWSLGRWGLNNTQQSNNSRRPALLGQQGRVELKS